jgi:hypothetical protein
MTQDEIEEVILKGKATDKDTGEWFSKYHDKNYSVKGLNENEYTDSTVKEEIQISRGIRSKYLLLNLIDVNAYMNETALRALLLFFEAEQRQSAASEKVYWSFHSNALRHALTQRGIIKKTVQDFSTNA